ncbi:hypothetical protein [Marisediminicola senii]|uniref:hypothetical protein n=1 Tax=Marisediminicola senii TaxID=2711233 RepID=UPI0013ED4AB9|nr:hypothetical protein [Marisediminicola senii]
MSELLPDAIALMVEHIEESRSTADPALVTLITRLAVSDGTYEEQWTLVHQLAIRRIETRRGE